MPYVLLTADRTYTNNAGREERQALQFAHDYAMQVDYHDNIRTPTPYRADGGGRYRHVEMRPISGFRVRTGSQLELERERALALECVVQGYRDAALVGAGGPIGVCVGHGLAANNQAWVDLAPVQLLRVSVEWLEVHWRLRSMNPRPYPPSMESEAFDAIGAALSSRPRAQRVDLYSCSVGETTAGQALLDWLHYLWGVPVRGLRGELELSGNPINPVVPAQAQVLRPEGYRGRGEFGRVFEDRLIEGRGLWRSSTNHRPALLGVSPTAIPDPPTFSNP